MVLVSCKNMENSKNMEHGSAECSCMKSSSSRQPTRWGVKLGGWEKKASFGRKMGGRLLGFAPGLPLSRGNYGQISEKSKIWP